MRDGPPEWVKKVHKSIHLVNPIIKVWVIHRVWVVISGLLRMARETVGSVSSTWNVYKGKVEKEYGHNPAVDTGGQGEVRVR